MLYLSLRVKQDGYFHVGWFTQRLQREDKVIRAIPVSGAEKISCTIFINTRQECRARDVSGIEKRFVVQRFKLLIGSRSLAIMRSRQALDIFLLSSQFKIELFLWKRKRRWNR